jgi:outer membrane protein assembly factor BamB
LLSIRGLRAAALVTAVVLVGGLLGTGRARALSAPLCSQSTPSAGGDWPAYGGDPHDSRAQLAESTIGPAKASGLSPRWVFSGAANGGSGVTDSTPVEANGCVFVGTSTGWVYAVNADTGSLAWKRQLPAPNPGAGGAIVGAPAVDRGTVYVLVNETSDGTADNGPYVTALDERTGAPRWRSHSIATFAGDYTNASPIVMPVAGGRPGGDRVVFAGFSPVEGNSKGQGGFALVSADSGAIVATTFTVPPQDQAKGFAGGGIWSTPAFDPATGFAYIGTGNPYSKVVEHPNTNAILKIDLHQASLGAIVASYKGDPDQYTQALQTLATSPACAASEAAPTPADDPVCGQLDLDFGAGTNLFTGPAGQLLVGNLQKAGVYHAAEAGSMKGRWATIVGAPCHLCNAGSTAVDRSGHVFGVSAPGGAAFRLDAAGNRSWTSLAADAFHYQSTSTADGVAYTFDNQGFLDALDATTGAPLLKRPMAADTHQPMVALTSAGIAVARHRVLVAATGGAAGAAAVLTTPPSQVPPSAFDTFVIAYGA